MVKIRLSLQGVKKKPFYRIIVTDSRSPRDGKFIEQIGFFDPKNSEGNKRINLNYDRMRYWMQNGAILSRRMHYIAKNYSQKEKYNS